MGFCKNRNHEKSLLVRLQQSNGRWKCRFQCQKCGAFTSSYQRHPENFDSLPMMNQEIIDRSAKESQAENKIKRIQWRENYENYLESEEWQQKRAEAFEYYKYACQLCGAQANQVHHLSYTNVGNEPMEDLQIVCKDCHQKIHGRAF